MVNVSIMVKGLEEQNLNVDINEKYILISYTKSGAEFSKRIELLHDIIPHESSFKVLSTKLEIKLRKCDGEAWQGLEKKEDKSIKINKDWDKIVHDIEGEAEDDGDPLNNLFQKIYKDGNDETRKAMIKSFTESHGTVLSTNWSDVKQKEVDTKAPDGMEFKKYDY